MEYGYYDPAQYAVTVPPGNNPYGSQGALKCEQCRTRRKKCEYQRPDLPCAYCASHGLSQTCVKTLAVPGTVNPPPTLAQAAPTNPARPFNKVSECALFYESHYPNATFDQILKMIWDAYPPPLTGVVAPGTSGTQFGGAGGQGAADPTGGVGGVGGYTGMSGGMPGYPYTGY